jgi:3-dehydroquinate synthetase
MRIGYGAIDEASKVLASAVGKPRRAIYVHRLDLDGDVALAIRRQVIDAGFEVVDYVVEGADVRTLGAATKLTEALLAAGITGDDLCVVAGDADLLSVVSHVLGTWCAGTAVVAFPTDEVALFEGALVPRGLDVAGSPEMITVMPSVKRVMVDSDIAFSPVASERGRYVRALMVAAAMCGTERDVQTLWDVAEQIMAGDEAAYVNALIACAKSRGQIVSSSAVAIRQSVSYGRAFAQAVAGLSAEELPAAELLGEGLRFAARISVGLEKLSIDDMLAQDELLEALGIGTISCSLEPEALVAALKAESFRRQNRFHVLVPLALGRVRLTAVADDLLLEHASAWCAAHAPQGA